jgi:hypothetical protein
LVVDVEMLCAPTFLITRDPSTVPGEHLGAIDVAFIFRIPKEIVRHLLTEDMIVNFNGIGYDRKHSRPFTIMVNLRANCGTMLVIFFPGYIDTVISATFGQKFILSVIMEENIDIAFNLLSGRPVNLAVLLKALLFSHQFLVPFPTLQIALLELCVTAGVLTFVLLAKALLEFLLVGITLHISGEEIVIGGFAIRIEY